MSFKRGEVLRSAQLNDLARRVAEAEGDVDARKAGDAANAAAIAQEVTDRAAAIAAERAARITAAQAETAARVAAFVAEAAERRGELERLAPLITRASRAALVTILAGDVPPAWVPPGAIIKAADTGTEWLHSGEGALVADMPGCVPLGDLTPQHFGAVAPDATAAIAAMMAGAVAMGRANVRVPPGAYTVSAATEIPHAVRSVDMTGAYIVQTAAASIWTRFGTVDGTPHSPPGLLAGDRLLAFDAAQTALYAAGDWVLLRANNLIPTQTAGSRVSVLRQIESASAGVLRLDAAANRDMNNSLTVRKVFPAPPIRLVGGTMEHQTKENKQALVKFFLTLDPDFHGCRIGNNGGPAISLLYTVGGEFINSHVYDLRDDEEAGYFGYGVQLAGACRGFRFTSGTARRVRHAITTTTVVANVGPAELAGLIDFRGEPEAGVWGPSLWAYDTSNVAFDTHAEGYGIVIIPHASGCYGGVNIRATNVSVQGGALFGVRRHGIRLSAAPSNSPALIPIKAHISKTLIDMVAPDGVGGAERIGITCVNPGIEAHIDSVRIVGAQIGLHGVDKTRLIVRDGFIDCAGIAESVGVILNGQNSDIDGLVVRNSAAGISEAATGAGNTWSRFRTENVAAPEIRVPTYATGGRHNQFAGAAGVLNEHEVPVGYFIPGRYYSGQGGVGTTATQNEALRVYPFLIRQDIVVDRIGVGVSTAAAASAVRLGIYADNGQGYPGALVLDAGTIDGGSATAQEIVISQALPAGLYWLGTVSQGGAPTLRTVSTTAQSVGSTTLAVAVQAAAGYVATAIGGALPATFPTGRDATTYAGRVVLRVAP